MLRSAGAAATAVLLALVATSATAAPSSLHRAANAEAPSLDPSLGSSTIAAPVISDLVEGPAARTPALKPAPACAESWTVSEDGLTWTFRLRPGLRWSDGTPLTAEDFVYSYWRLLDPATGAPSAGLFFVIENARRIATRAAPPGIARRQCPDERTVEFRWNFPHLIPAAARQHAGCASAPPRHREGGANGPSGAMVSNGPYVLAERVPPEPHQARTQPALLGGRRGASTRSTGIRTPTWARRCGVFARASSMSC